MNHMEYEYPDFELVEVDTSDIIMISGTQVGSPDEGTWLPGGRQKEGACDNFTRPFIKYMDYSPRRCGSSTLLSPPLAMITSSTAIIINSISGSEYTNFFMIASFNQLFDTVSHAALIPSANVFTFASTLPVVSAEALVAYSYTVSLVKVP